MSGNESLVDLNALRFLTSIGGYFRVSSNPNLVHFDGLVNLESVGGYMEVLLCLFG